MDRKLAQAAKGSVMGRKQSMEQGRRESIEVITESSMATGPYFTGTAESFNKEEFLESTKQELERLQTSNQQLRKRSQDLDEQLSKIEGMKKVASKNESNVKVVKDQFKVDPPYATVSLSPVRTEDSTYVSQSTMEGSLVENKERQERQGKEERMRLLLESKSILSRDRFPQDYVVHAQDKIVDNASKPTRNKSIDHLFEFQEDELTTQDPYTSSRRSRDDQDAPLPIQVESSCTLSRELIDQIFDEDDGDNLERVSPEILIKEELIDEEEDSKVDGIICQSINVDDLLDSSFEEKPCLEYIEQKPVGEIKKEGLQEGVAKMFEKCLKNASVVISKDIFEDISTSDKGYIKKEVDSQARKMEVVVKVESETPTTDDAGADDSVMQPQVETQPRKVKVNPKYAKVDTKIPKDSTHVSQSLNVVARRTSQSLIFNADVVVNEPQPQEKVERKPRGRPPKVKVNPKYKNVDKCLSPLDNLQNSSVAEMKSEQFPATAPGVEPKAETQIRKVKVNAKYIKMKPSTDDIKTSPENMKTASAHDEMVTKDELQEDSIAPTIEPEEESIRCQFESEDQVCLSCRYMVSSSELPEHQKTMSGIHQFR